MLELLHYQREHHHNILYPVNDTILVYYTSVALSVTPIFYFGGVLSYLHTHFVRRALHHGECIEPCCEETIRSWIEYSQSARVASITPEEKKLGNEKLQRTMTS